MKKSVAFVMLLVVLAGLLPAARPVVAQEVAAETALAGPSEPGLDYVEGPFRSQVELRYPRDLLRLEEAGVVVLQVDGDTATVLLTREQLDQIVRLNFVVRHTDSLAALGLPSLGVDLKSPALQRVALAVPMADADGDGLSDTEEAWWCTDPGNPDSDSDLVEDGAEVSALVDWVHDPRTGRPSSGKPFIGWPPSHAGCYDDDYDSIPDLAETNMLGLNINLESTDRDKFDDGQELFGSTYCPGGSGSCGYGGFPRDVDGGIIPPQMPAWIQAPGNHPMVAAFPEPVIQVLADSLRIDKVAIITTEQGEMTQQTNTYETSVTRGTSTSVTDMQTWNDWQEVATSEPSGDGKRVALEPVFLDANGQMITGLPKWLKVTGGVLGVVGSIGGGVACVVGTAAIGTPACIAFAAAGVGASVVGLADAIADDPDSDGEINVYSESTTNNIQINNLQIGADNQHYTSEMQDLAEGWGGNRYSVDESNQAHRETIAQVQSPVSKPQPTTTRSHGTSHGGSHSVTTSTYEEHTVTEGYAFTSGENWSTAWTTDTVHAADLRFSFQVCNEGTDYAREITGLIFNIYLTGDPYPIHTYNASAQIGTLSNVMPGECHTYTSDPVALTLDEMRAIDTETNGYVVVEDYAFGNDENFHQDATEAGITVVVEDGLGDGDELVDNYILPTWGNEPLQTVLQRYFPTIEDERGNLVAIYTPEFVPSLTFVERPLKNNNWWNVYFTGGLTHTGALSQTMVQDPGNWPPIGTVIRLGYDRDYDGYSDRTEIKLGTDPQDLSSHPAPELVAGYTVTSTGNTATVLMSFLNEGDYDAYGVEAVMFAPDDSISIANNTIGGGGRVAAGQWIALGSRVFAPGLGNWTGSAQPYAGGRYSGDQDKVYTFAATGSGQIGQGTLNLNWNDGVGSNGTLEVGSTYHPPLALDVAEGLQVAFDTGTVQAGDIFTVAVRLPGDTMVYTINSEPYTPPVIVVSYNDPQGNHRFITPLKLDSVYDDISGQGSSMLPNVSANITTLDAFDAKAEHTTYFVVQNPYTATLENAIVHVEIANITGTVVARWSLTQTLPPGPTVLSSTWNTAVFSEPYRLGDDYLMLIFWTDYQGNIIGSKGRMLSSFGEDPLGRSAAIGLFWDLGTVERGTVPEHELTVANVGRDMLYVWVSEGSPKSIRQDVGLDAILPGDLIVYPLLLDTSDLPTGPFSQTVQIRTSDVTDPLPELFISGEILTPSSNLIVYDNPWHPWDQRVYVEGPQSAGDQVEFSHTLQSDPDDLQPTGVYGFPAPTFWGYGSGFDPEDNLVARLITDSNAIRLTVPYTFTNGQSYLVPFGFESILPAGGTRTFSITVPYIGYDQVRLQAQSPALGIYDDFEGFR